MSDETGRPVPTGSFYGGLGARTPRAGLTGAADADAFLVSCVLAAPQIPLTLVPALINKEAEASATKANSSVYSIRSWPDSSCQKFFIKEIALSSPFVVLKVRPGC